jgi:hypothetical protein
MNQSADFHLCAGCPIVSCASLSFLDKRLVLASGGGGALYINTDVDNAFEYAITLMGMTSLTAASVIL